MLLLRSLLLDCGLDETIKWGKPCYTYAGGNVAILQGFKRYGALLFFKGVLMKDQNGILTRPGENSRVGRQFRFEQPTDITNLEPELRDYIRQAIELERAGTQVPGIADEELTLPDEVREVFANDPELQAGFEALTAGRQRGYRQYFSSAKQAKTRTARVEKCRERILSGRGYNER